MVALCSAHATPKKPHGFGAGDTLYPCDGRRRTGASVAQWQSAGLPSRIGRFNSSRSLQTGCARIAQRRVRRISTPSIQVQVLVRVPDSDGGCSSGGRASGCGPEDMGSTPISRTIFTRAAPPPSLALASGCGRLLGARPGPPHFRLGSSTARTPDCRSGDRGSIPRRGANIAGG